MSSRSISPLGRGGDDRGSVSPRKNEEVNGRWDSENANRPGAGEDEAPAGQGGGFQQRGFGGRGQNREHKIFIGALPNDLSEAELREIFEPHGRVEGIEMKRDKGYAFVDLGSFSACQQMIEKLGDPLLRGKPIHLEHAKADKKFRPNENGCFRCGHPDHWARECPTLRSRDDDRAGGSRRDVLYDERGRRYDDRTRSDERRVDDRRFDDRRLDDRRLPPPVDDRRGPPPSAGRFDDRRLDFGNPGVAGRERDLGREGYVSRGPIDVGRGHSDREAYSARMERDLGAGGGGGRDAYSSRPPGDRDFHHRDNFGSRGSGPSGYSDRDDRRVRPPDDYRRDFPPPARDNYHSGMDRPPSYDRRDYPPQSMYPGGSSAPRGGYDDYRGPPTPSSSRGPPRSSSSGGGGGASDRGRGRDDYPPSGSDYGRGHPAASKPYVDSHYSGSSRDRVPPPSYDGGNSRSGPSGGYGSRDSHHAGGRDGGVGPDHRHRDDRRFDPYAKSSAPPHRGSY